MSIGNNEKVLNLISSGEQIESLSKPYLNKLEQRYNAKNEAKSKYYLLRAEIDNAINAISKILRTESNRQEKIVRLSESIKQEAGRLYDIIFDETGEKNRVLDELSNVSILELNAEYANEMLISVKNAIPSKFTRILNLLESRSLQDDSSILEEFTDIKIELSKVRNSISNYKEYKNSNSEDLIRNLDNINTSIKSLNRDTGNLDKALSLADRVEIDEFPDSSELIDVIHTTRRPNMYIKRGYTILEYSKPVYSAMSYLREALTQKREFVGTQNALSRFFNAVNNLSNYYSEHFVQAGATPIRYHLHLGEKDRGYTNKRV